MPVAVLAISFQAMRAVLLAGATAANFGGLRLRSSVSQGAGQFQKRHICDFINNNDAHIDNLPKNA
jgi:hypothetical protein